MQQQRKLESDYGIRTQDLKLFIERTETELNQTRIELKKRDKEANKYERELGSTKQTYLFQLNDYEKEGNEWKTKYEELEIEHQKVILGKQDLEFEIKLFEKKEVEFSAILDKYEIEIGGLKKKYGVLRIFI